MHYEIKPNVPGQWYIHVKDNYTAPPVALFYDLDAAKVFVAAHSAEPKGMTESHALLSDLVKFMEISPTLSTEAWKDTRRNIYERARALLAKGE